MSRTKLVVCLVAVVVVGFAFGWFLMGQGPEPRAISTDAPPVQATKPVSKAGFCCVEVGSACRSAENPGECFRAGGRAFNTVQKNCDYYCTNVTP